MEIRPVVSSARTDSRVIVTRLARTRTGTDPEVTINRSDVNYRLHALNQGLSLCRMHGTDDGLYVPTL